MSRIPFFMALLFILSVCALPGQALADGREALAGEYDILGWDPGNGPPAQPDYEGRAVLRIWGDVLSYRGYMDGMTYAGACIYDEEAKSLSLSFTNVDGTERGVTLMKIEDGTLKGKWVMDNGRDGRTGIEVWTKK